MSYIVQKGELILYKTDDGQVEIQLRAVEGTVWLIQEEIAQLFSKGRSTIAEHIQNILQTGELDKNSVCRNFRRTANDGKSYDKTHYNLDMILAVGYWTGSIVRKQDVSISKNYLKKHEIEDLNRIVTMYLDYAEEQAKKRQAMTMQKWVEKLDAFLKFNERDLLDHSGQVTAEVAKKLAEDRYEHFDSNRKILSAKKADKEDIKDLENLVKRVDKGPVKTEIE